MNKTIFLVAGARPNFMKIAPIVRALKKYSELNWKIVHTGQHYDRDMNEVFFEELGIPNPDFFMGCGGGTHSEQTAKIMVEFERLCMTNKPDCVLVVGDVNSTLACSIVAKKLNIPVAHVEAGLRSGDMTMPEEINRLVTDSISDWFFVTEPSGAKHLLSEGKPQSAVHSVGHVMVDNLFFQVEKLKQTDASEFSGAQYKERYAKYGVVTLHRPSNVDNKAVLSEICEALNYIAECIPLVFPVHPRTKKQLDAFGLVLNEAIQVTGPLAYMNFLNLWKDAELVITDSGGLQEETTALGIPCVTVRNNTERPVTVEDGTNMLVGTSRDKIVEAAEMILAGKGKHGKVPDLWDGHAAERIVSVLVKELLKR